MANAMNAAMASADSARRMPVSCPWIMAVMAASVMRLPLSRFPQQTFEGGKGSFMLSK